MGKIYSFGEWQLDARLCELRSAGKPLELEPKVFDVLLYLIEHRDRVVSNEELIRAYGLDRLSVRQHWFATVIAARRTIGDNGRVQRCIKTLRNRGYRFVAPVEERVDTASREGSPGCDVAVSPQRGTPAGPGWRRQLHLPCHLNNRTAAIRWACPSTADDAARGIHSMSAVSAGEQCDGEFLWGVRDPFSLGLSCLWSCRKSAHASAPPVGRRSRGQPARVLCH